jgi:cellulose synthase/poly-beta-1,6-N-acetylglucosamine synthase-like glycosyltransferase
MIMWSYLILKGLAVVYAACGLAYWLAQFVSTLRVIHSVPSLDHMPETPLESYPRVSVIAPACNEADTIEAAVTTRLQDDYSDLEIILLDDRSTDGTREIVDRLAASDPRVKAVHIKELPEGWIGKQYAMQKGTEMATGDWLLFSDADIHIRPGALKRAIAFCQARNLDHLAVLPQCYPAGFFIDAAVAMILRMICFYGKLWAVPDEKSDAAMGSGSFNLIRRAAFEKAGGFEWLKLEVADDAALGRRLKQTGARSSAAHGPGWVGVHFYNDMKTLARATERAGFTTIGNFTVWRTVLVSLIFIALDTASFFALLPLGIPYLPFAGLARLLIAIATLALISGWARHPLLPTLAWPVGTFITVILLVRAGILGKRRGGIYWRGGTFYPTRMLKEGRRVKFKGGLKYEGSLRSSPNASRSLPVDRETKD